MATNTSFWEFSPDPPDPADPADQVSSAAVQNLPETRAACQYDCSYNSSPKLVTGSNMDLAADFQT